jgi:hypothetical protein
LDLDPLMRKFSARGTGSSPDETALYLKRGGRVLVWTGNACSGAGGPER